MPTSLPGGEEVAEEERAGPLSSVKLERFSQEADRIILDLIILVLIWPGLFTIGRFSDELFSGTFSGD